MSVPGIQAVAPDGTRLAVDRGENGVTYIDVLDLPSRRRTASWRANGHRNSGLVFSPDGKSLFVSRNSGDVFDPKSHFSQIWDVGTGEPTSLLMAATTDAVYAPSGDRLLTTTDLQRSVRDAATGRERGSRVLLSRGSPSAWHPDGRTVLTPTLDDTSRLWQVSADAEALSNDGTDKNASMTGTVAYRRSRGFNTFRGGRLRADGKSAVSLAEGAAGGRELIRSVDPSTGRSFGRPAPHYPGWIVRTVAFSPDGRSFATGSNPYDRVASEVRLWDTTTGRLLFPPMPHTNWAAALAFQPDGKVLAAGDYHGLVRTWDTSNGKEIGRPLPQGELVTSLAYSPDGNMLAVGLAIDRTRKPGTRLWNTRTRQPIGDLFPSADTITRIEFRPDGRVLLAGTDHSTRLWDTTQGRALSEPIMGEQAGGFYPDGRAFLTVGRDGTIKLRDAETGAALTTLMACPSPATCATFRGDGGLVAAGFDDGSVRLCDLATKQPVGPPRFMRHAVQHLTFTFDGRSVAAIDDFGESHTWPVPEPLLDLSLDDLTLRIEARTGLRMETGLAISRLDASAWRERLEQLSRLDPTALRLDDGPAWHEPMVREAEQNGNAFAAIWHLDRLIAAHPDDWFLYARRARAWSRSDQFDKAAADYQQAERLGAREQVLDFQTHYVIDCTRAERWAEALWYLDRLIAARPDDGSLHEDCAAVYGKLGREADRQAELARVFELGADQGLVIPRAEELGRAGRWAEAASLLVRCGRTGSLSQELVQAWGIACLKAHDRPGYREACAAFLTCQGPTPTVVWNELSAASLFALGAEGLDDFQVPISWFENRLSATPPPRPLYRHLFSNALGGLLLRAGRIDEAIARVNEGIAAAKDVELPSDWAYLALAHARKGSIAEARRWLERLRAARPDSSASFWDIQELALLRSETESRILDAEFPSDPFQGPGPT